MSQDITGAVVFVTGANRGIGKAFVEEAVEQEAAKVYAAARDPEKLKDLVSLNPEKVIAVKLDVTKQNEVDAAAELAEDVTYLVSNAGVANMGSFLSAPNLEGAQQELDVNYLGMLRMARAFAPILKKNGGGVLVNNISVAGHINFPFAATYSSSKAAAHSLTMGLRAELALQNTFVAGVYPGPIDTDMAAGVEMAKESPTNVARYVYQSVKEGAEDIFPDQYAQGFAQSLKADPKAVEKQIGSMIQPAS